MTINYIFYFVGTLNLFGRCKADYMWIHVYFLLDRDAVRS